MAVHAALSGGAWDCRACGEELRRLRNCAGRTNPGFRTVVGGAVLSRCPNACVTPLSRALLTRWQRSRLFGPYGHGGIEGQPEFVAEAMEAIEHEMIKSEGRIKNEE